MTTRPDPQTSAAALLTGASAPLPSPVQGSRPASIKTLFTDREAAAYLGASKSTIWRWAAGGVIPRPLRIGGCSRWKVADLDAVIARAAAQREPTAA